jgi:hypothetical protein
VKNLQKQKQAKEKETENFQCKERKGEQKSFVNKKFLHFYAVREAISSACVFVDVCLIDFPPHSTGNASKAKCKLFIFLSACLIEKLLFPICIYVATKHDKKKKLCRALCPMSERKRLQTTIVTFF